MTAAWPIVTLSPIVVSCVPVIACTTAPSWTFVRRPTRITFTSPRTTAHIHTLLSSPISTSPMICALSSMNAVGWTRGAVPRYGRSIQYYIVSGMTSHETDLVALRELNEAYIRSVQTSDVQRFEQLLAADFLCSLPDGTLIDRARFLERTAALPNISNLAAHDVNVRILGDVAIVHGRTTYTTDDGRTGSGRYTDVWARRGGRWLAVSAHV